jgi:hypothetical protein
MKDGIHFVTGFTPSYDYYIFLPIVAAGPHFVCELGRGE